MVNLIRRTLAHIFYMPVLSVWAYAVASFIALVYISINTLFTDTAYQTPNDNTPDTDQLFEVGNFSDLGDSNYRRRGYNDIFITANKNSILLQRLQFDNDSHYMPCTPAYGCTETTISDKHGNSADVMFDRIGQNYYWQYGSQNKVMINSIDSLDVNYIFDDKYTKSRLRHAKEIIAIGMASSKGNNTQQEKLSKDRALNMIRSLKEKISSDETEKMHIMNIGRYFDEEDRDKQRIPLIVIVTKKNGEIDLANAIYDYLLREPIYGIRIDGFSIISRCKNKKSNTLENACIDIIPMN